VIVDEALDLGDLGIQVDMASAVAASPRSNASSPR